MKKYSFFLLFFYSVVQLAWGQQTAPIEITWETLSKVSFKKKIHAIDGGWYSHPFFGKEILALNGKEVSIKGFVFPFNTGEELYFLSAFPYSSCFFCGGAGPESVIQLELKKGQRTFKMDEVVRFKGKLLLNYDNLEQLNYVLQEAEIDRR